MNIDKLKTMANEYYEKNNKTEYADFDYSKLSTKSLLIIVACYSFNDPMEYLGKLKAWTNEEFYTIPKLGELSEDELNILIEENKKKQKQKQLNYVFTDEERKAKNEFFK